MSSSQDRPERLWAWFFLPLPEPLGLPDHYIWREFSEPKPTEMNADVDLDPAAAPDRLGPRVRASILLRDHPDAVDLDERLVPLFEAAVAAFPKLAGERRGETLEPRGHLTVAEVAVPLEGEADQDHLTAAFDNGLRAVRNLQQTYEFSTGQPLTPVFIGQMPAFVPCVLAPMDYEEARPDVDAAELVLFNLDPTAMARTTKPSELSDERLAHLAAVAEGINDHAFWPYAKSRHRAFALLERQGDYALCVVMAGTAAQQLLDTTLKHLAWEESVEPEDCAATFDSTGLTTRIRREYAGRLGGNWSLEGTRPVARYTSDLREVRHRVVHAGYEPSVTEARDAYQALTGLDKFIGDRLVAKRRIYPRTAKAFVGTAGFEHRGGRVPNHLEALMNDPDEPQWDRTFERWLFRVNALMAPEFHAKGDVAEMELLIVVEDGGPDAMVFDRHSRTCAAYDFDPPESVRNVVTKILSAQRDDPETLPQLVIRFLEAPDPSRVVGTWTPAEEILHGEHLHIHDPPWKR